MNQKTQSDLLVSVLPGLRAYVGRIAGDRQAVGDLLQEASVRILAGEGPEDPERFLAWCCGIARHVRASDWRARRRARTELPLESEAAAAVCAPQRDPDSHLDARAWVARAMAQTDRENLELLVRRYVLEETGSELADRLAQSAAALRMRLMRLRSALSDQAPDR